MSSKRFAKAQRATESGQNRGKQWTGPDMEIALRADLTVQEAAKMLGRTYAAVKMMRHRCKSDPKYAAVVGAPKDTHAARTA